MARPLSEQKRTAIIDAAAVAIAELGTSASTAKVASAAGVSEGTIFTYFPTKDDLLNQLYLEIKTELSHAMLDNYPSQADAEARIRHVWNGYIAWGVANAPRRKALKQLSVSDRIDGSTRRQAGALFDDLYGLFGEIAGKDHAVWLGAVHEAVGDTVFDFMQREPSKSEEYRTLGFELFWNGVSRKTP